MQYLFMCCFEEDKWNAIPEAEREVVMREYGAWIEAATASGQSNAFRWTATSGMQNLSTLYAGSGASYLTTAQAVSSDGLHVVGYGYNSSARNYRAYETK